MRRLSLLMLAALLLSTGTTFAQTDQTVTVTGDLTDPVDDSYWVGLSLGFPLGGSVHFGINDLIGNAIDTRFNASFAGGRVALGANAVFDFAIDTNLPLEIYGAVGPTLIFGNSDSNIDRRRFRLRHQCARWSGVPLYRPWFPARRCFF